MFLLKKMIHLLVPPIFGKFFRLFFQQKVVKTEKRPILKSEEIGSRALVLTIDEPLFTVPIDKLRYYGGLHYSYEQHHFLRYYKYGISALREFYQSHQPGNFLEEHFLPVPNCELRIDQFNQMDRVKYVRPWFSNPNYTIPEEEKGLSKKKHGEQRFGPVSEKKIALEAERLDSVLHSIKKNGFDPGRFDGYPRGYFFIDDNGEWIFLVRTGLHRVAALIHLGHKSIPFEFQRRHPRYIAQSDSSEWASVKDGYLTEQEGRDIFMSYLK